MLKRSIIILFSFLFLHLYANSINEENKPLQDALRSFIEKRCIANGGSDAFKNLKYSIDDFRSCINREIIAFGANDEDEALQKLCSSTRNSLHFCTSLILDQLKLCLDKQEYFLSNFVSGWFNYTFDEHCKGGGGTIKDHIGEVAGLDCKAVDEILAHKVAEECFLESILIKDFESQDFIITKDNLCDYLERGNKCLMDFLKKDCDSKFLAFVEYHLRPTKLWCDKYVHVQD